MNFGEAADLDSSSCDLVARLSPIRVRGMT